MKLGYFLGLILGLSALIGCNQRKPIDPPENLKKVLTNFFDGIRDKDFKKMRYATTYDFVLYEDGLVWNLDSAFLNIKKHMPFAVRYKFDNFKIFVDDMSADMTYFNHADFLFHDTLKESIDWVESATFRKNNEGIWKMNFLQVTVRN